MYPQMSQGEVLFWWDHAKPQNITQRNVGNIKTQPTTYWKHKKSSGQCENKKRREIGKVVCLMLPAPKSECFRFFV